ncbi:hypothetical protein CRU98_06420 [Arcobacter sp. CECT 8986]|uniref:SEL1-like repeat protein n=1 Tax=Arcobacter sp. CECT 8986 TaxID=2044507 RepID=UPI001009C757|nr:tetratricopeptide repeat protein [Arcobacter sp. CECT 8986]RXJ99657.1 hypothetical protein CRU98_06420 [Arcobacter sp. CECT 8986]
MNLSIKSLFILIIFSMLLASCRDEKVELKKSIYDIKQCNKRIYTKEDLEDYKKLIKDGEIQGYNCVGLYYMRDKDYKKAEEYFNKGKEKGSIESYLQLGSLYSNFLNEKDKAIEYYKIAANNGKEKAAHNLGVIYDKRFQYKKALKWYEKSFEKGDTYSLLAMAHIYRKQEKYEKAIETFKEAAKLGELGAYHSLGVFYRKEKLFKDDKKGLDYYKKGYELGSGLCAAALGTYYEEDLKDYEKAIEWYKKGLELGSEESVNRLGFIYWEVLKDNQKAIYWFKKGYEELDCISCLASVANVYTKNKDYEKSIKWYELAYKKGNDKAAYNLGLTYQDYLKNKEKAIEWYKKALDSSVKYNAIARLKELGIIYE